MSLFAFGYGRGLSACKPIESEKIRNNEEKQQIFNKLQTNPIKPANFMYINTCCFAFANLLSGRTNTLVLSATKPWDVIPGIFMVQEAGINSYSINGLNVNNYLKIIKKKK